MAPSMSPSSTFSKDAKRKRAPPPLGKKGILSAKALDWSPASFSNCLSTVSKGVREPVNKALLIGIQYEGNEHHGQLTLAHQDVQKVKKMLIDLYHFDEKNIIVLMDDADDHHKQPTRVNILAAFEQLMRGVQKGDTLYFHYSGHGEQVDSAPGDTTEEDGKDEAIVPCDATQEPDTWILDNILNERLVKQLPVGAYLFAVFDMCHSGTALDLSNYDYPCNNLLKKCTRKLSAGVRKMSLALTRKASRTASEAQQRPPSMHQALRSKQSIDRCVVITSERLSLARVKSKKLSVDVRPPTLVSTAQQDVKSKARTRRFSLSKSEKAYMLEYRACSAGAEVPESAGRTSADRLSGHTLISQNLPVILESSTELDSWSFVQSSSLQPPHKLVIQRGRKPFSFVWLLVQKFIHELRTRVRINRRNAHVKAEDREWNVFSPVGLSKRKSTVRTSLAKASACNAECSVREQEPLTGTFLPSGVLFDSPPSSPKAGSSSNHVNWPTSEAKTGQVVSIAAANDAQLAMEYMDKDNVMKSLTSILVEILYSNPHPTVGNLMTDLSKWLQSSSLEMHQFFEKRKKEYDAKAQDPNFRTSPSPRNTQEKEFTKLMDEMQSMVLSKKPIQQPVLGTEIRMNVENERILPLVIG